ncbi:hypothetical protein B0O99DRAFT_604144, partial [Bisporella sp. PMI_857]
MKFCVTEWMAVRRSSQFFSLEDWSPLYRVRVPWYTIAGNQDGTLSCYVDVSKF